MTLERSPSTKVGLYYGSELSTLLYSALSVLRLILLVRHDGFVVFIHSLFVPTIYFAPKSDLNYKKELKNSFYLTEDY